MGWGNETESTVGRYRARCGGETRDCGRGSPLGNVSGRASRASGGSGPQRYGGWANENGWVSGSVIGCGCATGNESAMGTRGDDRGCWTANETGSATATDHDQ